MFWCTPGSPIAVAAARARPALLTIPVRTGGLSVTVVLAGRLTLLPVNNIYGARTEVAALDLDQVFVERGGPTKPSLAKYEVPLEIYIESQPDPIADYGAQLIEHTNLAHHCELRDFVAARHGVPSEAIAGASLAALDELGGQVHLGRCRRRTRHNDHLHRAGPNAECAGRNAAQPADRAVPDLICPLRRSGKTEVRLGHLRRRAG
jgi:hypothetical protein